MARRPRYPLRLKLTLLAAALAVGPLVGVGLVLIDVNAEAVERSARQLQIALADDIVRTLDAELASTEAALGAATAALTDASAPELVRVTTLEAIVAANDSVGAVHIYDASGVLIDTVSDHPGATSEVAADVLPAALRGLRPGELRYGDVASSPGLSGEGGLSLVLAMALVVDERVTGYVAAPVSLRPLQDRVGRVAEAHLASSEGSLFVVDGRRRVVASSRGGAALVVAPESGALAGVELASLRVPRSSTVGSVVGTVAPLGVEGWAVVVEVPTSQAYASLERMRVIVLTTVAATVLLALLLAVFFARRITAPLSTLSAFAGDLAARRFDRRVQIQTSDELAQLGDDLNASAEALETSEARIRKEEAIRADLGRFLPAELVDKVVRREHDMELGGRRLPISVLFADVVAFTPLTEELAPEDVVALLNELFSVLTEVVFRHGGTVDKFVGDAVMALFGAPEPRDDHARRALRAAEEMLVFLETMNPGWQERYGVTVQLAIGINTGEAVVGNVGSDKRMEYTAIGDVVNVAARLEALARPAQILITQATRDAAGEAFDYGDVGDHEIPGRSAPLRLFEVRP